MCRDKAAVSKLVDFIGIACVAWLPEVEHAYIQVAFQSDHNHTEGERSDLFQGSLTNGDIGGSEGLETTPAVVQLASLTKTP